MKSKRMLISVGLTITLVILGAGAAVGEDRYTLKVPNGLAFAEFKGYESWQVISISRKRRLWP